MIAQKVRLRGSPSKFAIGGIIILIAAFFTFLAVAFVVPQLGLLFFTLTVFSMIAISAVGTRLIRRALVGAHRFPWPLASLTITATFATAFLATLKLARLQFELAYLVALAGTMIVAGLILGAYERGLATDLRAALGKGR